MYFKLLNINVDKNKRLWAVIFGAVTIASILIWYVIYVLLIKKGVDLDIKKDEINKILLSNSYHYIANLTVKSNKNVNKYSIEERYHKKEENLDNNNFSEEFMFSTSNESGDIITYEIKDKTLSVKSSSQINEFTLSDYVVKKNNLISISTFVGLYNDIEKNITDNAINDEIKIEVEQLDDKTCYRIIFTDTEKVFLDKYKEAISKVGKLELFISNVSNLPIEYLVYDKENLAYIDIEYTFFEL